MYVFSRNFYIISITMQYNLSGNFRRRYSYLFIWINILSDDIWQCSNVQMCFFLWATVNLVVSVGVYDNLATLVRCSRPRVDRSIGRYLVFMRRLRNNRTTEIELGTVSVGPPPPLLCFRCCGSGCKCQWVQVESRFSCKKKGEEKNISRGQSRRGLIAALQSST